MPRISRPTKTPSFRNLGITALLLVGLFSGTRLALQNQDKRTKAYSPVDYNGRFDETVKFQLSSLSQIYGWFDENYKNTRTTKTPPSSHIIFDNGTVTFKDKSSLVVANPAKNDPFYKVEVTLQDNGNNALKAYLTFVDKLWSESSVIGGGSAGVQQISTYWWEHTEQKTQSQVSAAEWDFTVKTRNKFEVLKRKTVNEKTGVADVKIELYVTPIGIYPVINGVNFHSLPDMYIGKNIYQKTANYPNYFVIGKWDDGGSSITFKDFKITTLSNNVNSVADANAYFVKNAVDKKWIDGLIGTQNSSSGSTGFNNYAAKALLLSAHDYFYRTNYKSDIVAQYDSLIPLLRNYVNSNINTFGKIDPHIAVFSVLGPVQGLPIYTMGVFSQLTTQQRADLKSIYARIMDILPTTIVPDGSFPRKPVVTGGTAAEEMSWPLQFMSGYSALYPNDQPRVTEASDYIKFLAGYMLTDGKKLDQYVNPATIPLQNLSNDYRNFTINNARTNGQMDEHAFNPSLNYSLAAIGSAAAGNNVLAKASINFVPNPFHSNMANVFNNSIVAKWDLTTAKLKTTTPSYDEKTNVWSMQQDYYYTNSEGLVTDYWSRSKPSMLEDWTRPFTSYSVLENVGGWSAQADTLAKNVYYGFYSGSGIMFCFHNDVHGSPGCSAGTTNGYNFMFNEAIWSTLTSPNSNFYVAVEKSNTQYNTPPASESVNNSCAPGTRTVYISRKDGQNMDEITTGSTRYIRSSSPTWTRENLNTNEFYRQNNHAPCFNQSNCTFSTRVKYYDPQNNLAESITVGPKAYNFTYSDTGGWWDLGTHDLAAISRYRETDAPCKDKAAGTCIFSTRTVLVRPGTGIYDEFISIGTQYYKHSTQTNKWEAINHDLASSSHYNNGPYSPCYGKFPGQCTFDGATRFYDANGVATESIQVGTKYYNHTPGAGWWAISNPVFSSTARFIETNGPCLVPSAKYFQTAATPKPTATPKPGVTTPTRKPISAPTPTKGVSM